MHGKHLNLALLMVLGFYGLSSYGVVVTPSPVVGLMQQPTSQYYHSVYGGYLDLRTDDAKLIFRLSYIERPEFEAAGYSDQETAAFGLLGTTVVENKLWRMTTYIGGGQVEGYTKALNKNEDSPDRSFKLRGVTFELEINATIAKRLEVGLSHLSHIGWVDEKQLNSYVAWPYNFFMLRMGLAI